MINIPNQRGLFYNWESRIPFKCNWHSWSKSFKMALYKKTNNFSLCFAK